MFAHSTHRKSILLVTGTVVGSKGMDQTRLSIHCQYSAFVLSRPLFKILTMKFKYILVTLTCTSASVIEFGWAVLVYRKSKFFCHRTILFNRPLPVLTEENVGDAYAFDEVTCGIFASIRNAVTIVDRRVAHASAIDMVQQSILHCLPTPATVTFPKPCIFASALTNYQANYQRSLFQPR